MFRINGASREKAISFNNVGVSFHRSKNLGLALQWYTTGLHTIPLAYKCHIFEERVKLISTSEAEIITDDERASLILWSEKLMDEAFYLDPYQEKSFTYPVLSIYIYDDDEVNETLGCDEEGNEINCSSFSPTELDIVVTLMYNYAAARTYEGQQKEGKVTYENLVELFDQKGPQRVCNMTMKMYVSSQYLIQLIEFHHVILST